MTLGLAPENIQIARHWNRIRLVYCLLVQLRMLLKEGSVRP